MTENPHNENADQVGASSDASTEAPTSGFSAEDIDASLNNIAAEIESADSALQAAEAQAAEHLGDLQRLQAEYVNYRKRVDRDRALLTENAQIQFVEALLPVLDDVSGARDAGDLTGPFAAIVEKFEGVLTKYGWEQFGEVGEAFDPNLHDALMSVTDNSLEGPVIQHVVQPGHRIGERVVRAARVIVAQPE